MTGPAPGGDRRPSRAGGRRVEGGGPATGRRAATGRRGPGGPRAGGRVAAAARPAPVTPDLLTARRVAWELLRAVAARDAYANLLLPRLIRDRGLDTRDAALATELGYGALRAEGQLDHVIRLASNRPLGQIEQPLLDVLRLGAYQLLHTRVQPYAAVSATVALAKEAVAERTGGFTNAVLRRVAERAAGDDPLGLAGLAPDDALAIRTAHPRWVLDVIRTALGAAAEAELTAALEADDARPAVHLVARSLDRAALVEEATAAGLEATLGALSPRAVRLGGGDPARLAAVRAGAAAVQDEGSQLVALALSRADAPDGPVLDLCAGPGGKAALLAALLPDTPLTAVEVQPHRATLVREALQQHSPLATVVEGDARTVAGQREPAPTRVLVDAPCTGLGALRRRPEARWRRSPADAEALAPLQRELLTAALDAVAPGGVVLYATCSMDLRETTEVIDAVLAGRADVDREDVRPLLGGVPALGPGPTVQLWPHRQGTDAMFLALLRRRAAAPALR